MSFKQQSYRSRLKFLKLYHGTDVDSARRIKQEGLRGDRDTLTSSYGFAKIYARQKGEFGGPQARILEFHIPEEETGEYVGEGSRTGYEPDGEPNFIYTVKKIIPPKYIAKVHNPGSWESEAMKKGTLVIGHIPSNMPFMMERDMQRKRKNKA